VAQRNRPRWHGHVLRKDDDDDRVKKCVTLEVDVARQRSRPRKQWEEVVSKAMEWMMLWIVVNDMLRLKWNNRISGSDTDS